MLALFVGFSTKNSFILSPPKNVVLKLLLLLFSISKLIWKEEFGKLLLSFKNSKLKLFGGG